jgi:hypothetical protein
VDQNKSKITIISKDIIKLSFAIKRWDYFNTMEMKLLVVVKETLPVDERDEVRTALIASVDTPLMWSINHCYVPSQAVETCIIFFTGLTYVDLGLLWAKGLLEPIEAMLPPQLSATAIAAFHRPPAVIYYQSPQTYSFLPVIDPLPIGVIQLGGSGWSPRKPWFRASYVNLRLADFSIKTSITRPDLLIDVQPPTTFIDSPGNMRLMITEDCSVIVPLIPWSRIFLSRAWDTYPQYRWGQEGQRYFEWP